MGEIKMENMHAGIRGDLSLFCQFQKEKSFWHVKN